MFGVDFVNVFSSFVFLDYTSLFNICCKAGLVVLNSLNFCLSKKLLISPSILNEILARYSNLGCRFFPFSTSNISCPSLWPAEFLLKDLLLSIWGFPWPAMQEMQETWVQSLGREHPLKKEMAAHSSIFTCQIPWTVEPGKLQSMTSQKVGCK